MTHRLIFGTEQEYGIQLVGVDAADSPHPMQLSNRVIRAYRDDTVHDLVGYDYADESPLIDQWGFELARNEANPDLLTDQQPLASRMLTNGARFYVDHAHPEYSGPECASFKDAVRYERAGDLIMQQAADTASEGSDLIRLFKNNTDGKGQSYGSHENYLLDRSLPFDQVVAGFTAFLATRGVLVGAGRVGRGSASGQSGFQLTQRADFFEREVGLETTVRRPIINTRDEPHAKRGDYRRLHVITGDANISQVAIFVKIGSAALVLAALERGLLPEVRLAHPVLAMRTVSYDLDLEAKLELADGSSMSALDIQEIYADAVVKMLDQEYFDGTEANEVVTQWLDLLTALQTDPYRAADRIDWLAKYQLLETFIEREQLGWGSARLAAIDLQYGELDPRRGLALMLERKSKLRTVVDYAEIVAACTQPPEGTRAHLRGLLLRRWGSAITAVNWDSITFEFEKGGRKILRMTDPILDSESAESLMQAESLPQIKAILERQS